MDHQETNGFEPRIVAFCCHYCAFAAADLAGVLRLNYPANVHIVRLPCTGKLDTVYLLKAFEWGVDGVFVAGCLEGGCHFISGNLRAKRRVAHVRELLQELGIEPARLEFFNLSAAEGDRFVQIAREMTESIKRLGPSPAGKPVKLMSSDIDIKAQQEGRPSS
ncbi:MAG: hydrogenase iron-sulfur subunit [Anaerolineae bacterium]